MAEKKYNSQGIEIQPHSYKFPVPLFKEYKKLADNNKRSVNAQLEYDMDLAIEASKPFKPRQHLKAKSK